MSFRASDPPSVLERASEHVSEHASDPAPGEARAPMSEPEAGALDALFEGWPTLDQLRERYVSHMIAQAGGNKTQAAAMLGVDRRTVHRIEARRRAARKRLLKPPVEPPPAPPDPVAAPPRASGTVEERVTEGWPSLDEMSLRYLFEALERAGNNKRKAARVLGINSWTVRRILKRARRGRTPLMHTRL